MLENVAVAFLAAILALICWSIQQGIERRQRLERIKAALAVEIATLVELIQQQSYSSEFREHAARIRAAGQRFGYPIVCIPITHSYFSVFEANADLVGDLGTEDVVQVISFYQQARSLADSASKAGTPDNAITPAEDAANRYEALASAIDKLCDLGLAVSKKLTSEAVLAQVNEVAVRLRPA